jgi:lysophospholipase L1-like esterase
MRMRRRATRSTRMSIKQRLCILLLIVAISTAYLFTKIRPAAPKEHIVLVTLGDSITAGYDASEPCFPWPKPGLSLVPPFCNYGTSYVADLAHELAAQNGSTIYVLNLGISGAQISTLITDEISLVPQEATIITIYIGTNDIRHLTDAVLSGRKQTPLLSSLKASFRTMLAYVRTRAPSARIVLVNLPNQRYTAGLNTVASRRYRAYSNLSQALDRIVNAYYPDYPVVDLACDLRSYVPQNISHAPTSPHPNNSGHAALAQDIVDILRDPSIQPKFSCPPYLGN